MRTLRVLVTGALVTSAAVAHAQDAPSPICVSDAPADGTYTLPAAPFEGCVQPPRYDIAVVGGCVGVHGATSITPDGDLLRVAGPDWSATLDVGADGVLVTGSCADTPQPAALLEELDASSSAARAALLDDRRPDVRAAAVEASGRDQELEAACARLSAFVVDAPSWGSARRANATRALDLSTHACMEDAALEVATDPGLSAPAQRALARILTTDAQREVALLRLVSRGYDADILAASIEAPSIKLTASLASLAQSEGAQGELPARSALETMGASYEVSDYDEPDAGISETSGIPGMPELPGFGLSLNGGTLFGADSVDPAFSLWAGMKFFAGDGEGLQAMFTPGIQFAFGERVEVVPTLRVGVGYLMLDEEGGALDVFARSLTAVEVYTLVGARLPLAEPNGGVRVGLGIGSPIGLVLTALTLSAAEFPLPNAAEVLLDTDLETGAQTARINLTVGF